MSLCIVWIFPQDSIVFAIFISEGRLAEWVPLRVFGGWQAWVSRLAFWLYPFIHLPIHPCEPLKKLELPGFWQDLAKKQTVLRRTGADQTFWPNLLTRTSRSFQGLHARTSTGLSQNCRKDLHSLFKNFKGHPTEDFIQDHTQLLHKRKPGQNFRARTLHQPSSTHPKVL